MVNQICMITQSKNEIIDVVKYSQLYNQIKDDTIRETKFNCLDNLPEFMRITPSIKKTLELMVKNNLNLSNLNIEFKIGVDSVEETYYTFDFNYQEMIVIANTIDKGHREIYNFYSGCILDLDCNDGDDNTIDTCLLPSTEYASCKNEK